MEPQTSTYIPHHYPVHSYDYIYLGKGAHYHEACRKVRSRGAIGGLMEIQFASGEGMIVPRSMIRNIGWRTK